MRLLALPLLLLLLAGCTVVEPADTGEATSDAGADDAETAAACPGHWHAAVTFFVHDARVEFTPHPHYTLEGGTMPLRTHMHRGSESLWHFEPTRTACIPLREALATVDVGLESGRLELRGEYHAERGWGGTHQEADGQALEAWVRPYGGDWEPADIDGLAAAQVPDGAQVLVAFGAHDADDVARMQEAAYPYPESLRPRDA